jgi:hypothetical protein
MAAPQAKDALCWFVLKTAHKKLSDIYDWRLRGRPNLQMPNNL